MAAASSGQSFGPFKATQIWNGIIHHLQEHANVRRHRRGLKYHQHCFTGADAVSVLLMYLQDNSFQFGACDITRMKVIRLCQDNSFQFGACDITRMKVIRLCQVRTQCFTLIQETDMTRFVSVAVGAVGVLLMYLQDNSFQFGACDITRMKVIRLCQVLMDNGVFQPVGMKAKSKGKSRPFDDSNSKLYRFTKASKSADGKENVAMSSEDSQSDEDESGVIQNTLAMATSDEILRELFGETYSQETESIWSSTSSLASNGSSCSISHADLSVLDEVWKEMTLVKLLTIVELPLLDGILSMCSEAKQHRLSMRRGLVISNTCTASSDSDSDSINYFLTHDPWITSGLSCLDFMPETIGMKLSDTAADTREWKLSLYQAIADHYTHLHEPLLTNRLFDVHVAVLGLIDCTHIDKPLLTNRLFDVHVAVLGLIVKSKLAQAVKALQLVLLLLPSESREELRRLLRFMALCSTNTQLLFHNKCDNRTSIRRAFTKAVVRNPVLGKGQTEQLVMYMVDNHREIFQIPPDLKEAVEMKIQSLRAGAKPEDIPLGKVAGRNPSLPAVGFCKRITIQEYEAQAITETEKALVDMMNGILDHTKMTVKEKQRRLNDFWRHHPKIYAKFFSGMM
ncbi:DEP domain-containing protein 7-like [Branchiostoma floridae]|uniref:DEP domain-containing protein 7-like n=1 Tax=Branchiostoma floridae TaxID=7739 RepID=A0A9J7KKG4_BRAFL|nr:DEP domain-containing protein 7-like [Branchiostoma floridae]